DFWLDGRRLRDEAEPGRRDAQRDVPGEPHALASPEERLGRGLARPDAWRRDPVEAIVNRLAHEVPAAVRTDPRIPVTERQDRRAVEEIGAARRADREPELDREAVGAFGATDHYQTVTVTCGRPPAPPAPEREPSRGMFAPPPPPPFVGAPAPPSPAIDGWPSPCQPFPSALPPPEPSAPLPAGTSPAPPGPVGPVA